MKFKWRLLVATTFFCLSGTFTFVFSQSNSTCEDCKITPPDGNSNEIVCLNSKQIRDRVEYLAPLNNPGYADLTRITDRTVVVSVFIDGQGRVIKSKAVKGHPLLKASGEQAARFSRFTPVNVSGKPANICGSIILEWNPDDSVSKTGKKNEEAVPTQAVTTQFDKTKNDSDGLLNTRIEDNIRINKDYPTVYITFERFAENEAVFAAESGQRIYLRLHNNTKWQIFLFPFYFGAQDELSLFHEVERENSNIRTEIPTGYNKAYKLRLTLLPVAPGKSALFNVPREHLAKNLLIRTDFLYSWEDYELSEEAPLAPRYTVAFRSSDLPRLNYEMSNFNLKNTQKVKKTGSVKAKMPSRKYSVKRY